jgi:hypothetical protein
MVVANLEDKRIMMHSLACRTLCAGTGTAVQQSRNRIDFDEPRLPDNTAGQESRTVDN